MSGLGCDRTHGRSGSAQIETNKFQSTLPEGSDRRHQQICGASLRRRVERPHHDTSQVLHLLKIPDFLFVSEFDRSAARGNMAVRKLYVFKHSSALGDAPSWKLFDSINVHKRDGADVARNFSDYEVQVNREAIPDSVSVSEMVDHTL